MNFEEFSASLETLLANLFALKTALISTTYPFQFMDYDMSVCEAASEISGADATFCKMFNKSFREDALSMMFDRALEAVN